MRLLLAVAALALSLDPAWAVGKASYYGPGFHGRLTASGEVFDQHDMTCAHKGYKFGTIVRVTNLVNGRSAVCRINDRGPFVLGRVLDVSVAVAKALGMIRAGVVPVQIEIVK